MKKDTSASPTETGVIAGRYRLIREIGRGGMGVVYRAADEAFGRSLAIKILGASGGEREARFLEEARVTGRLQHPGIPPVHDLGRLKDGQPYFSMKLIEGRTLGDLLRDRTQPGQDRSRYLAIFEQIAQTLAYAHS